MLKAFSHLHAYKHQRKKETDIQINSVLHVSSNPRKLCCLNVLASSNQYNEDDDY